MSQLGQSRLQEYTVCTRDGFFAYELPEMPRLKNKDISIRLVRVAEPWSCMYNISK